MMVSTVALAGFIFLSVFGESEYRYFATYITCSPEPGYFGGRSSTLWSCESGHVI
jgi:hypothetical protein